MSKKIQNHQRFRIVNGYAEKKKVTLNFFSSKGAGNFIAWLNSCEEKVKSK